MLELDWIWSVVAAGSTGDSWSFDLRDQRCGTLEERRLSEDLFGEEDPEFGAYRRHSR